MELPPPDPGVAARAAARFDAIRAASLDALAGGALDRELSAGGFAVPSGRCVSTIARLERNAPGLLPAVIAVQAAIAEVGDGFSYPAASLHLSLLGLTGREDDQFSPARVGRLQDVFRRVVGALAPCPMTLTGLNLIGNQWFLEVVPSDGRWAAARGELATAAAEAGEAPMVHADREPIHLNLARTTRLRRADLAAELLRRPVPAATITVSTIELVVTDFVVEVASTIVVDTVHLGGAG